MVQMLHVLCGDWFVVITILKLRRINKTHKNYMKTTEVTALSSGILLRFTGMQRKYPMDLRLTSWKPLYCSQLGQSQQFLFP